MRDSINIIEPTLMNEAGHCYSFVNALVQTNISDIALHLWANRCAELAFSSGHVEVHKHFFRRLRRLQSYFLYRQLLDTQEKIFVSTAGFGDILVIDWAAKRVIPRGKVYLYIHWFNPNEKKLVSLRKIAINQPNLTILGPTLSVVKIFQQAGFVDARVVPYPISPRTNKCDVGSNTYRHLLYAGAARRDKGFKLVVDLVDYLYKQKSNLQIILQVSAEHFGKYDSTILADIERLKVIPYPYLQLKTETLSTNEYECLFAGAIVLQLYDVNDFSDRISGVTLDAFSNGCPVISTSGTWIARMVERFDAGSVTDDVLPQSLLKKVSDIIANYVHVGAKANAAGQVLQQENNAVLLYKVLTEN